MVDRAVLCESSANSSFSHASGLLHHTLMVKVARSWETGLALGRPAEVCLVALFVTDAIDLAWAPTLPALAKALALNRTCLYMMKLRSMVLVELCLVH